MLNIFNEGETLGIVKDDLIAELILKDLVISFDQFLDARNFLQMNAKSFYCLYNDEYDKSQKCMLMGPVMSPVKIHATNEILLRQNQSKITDS